MPAICNIARSLAEAAGPISAWTRAAKEPVWDISPLLFTLMDNKLSKYAPAWISAAPKPKALRIGKVKPLGIARRRIWLMKLAALMGWRWRILHFVRVTLWARLGLVRNSYRSESGYWCLYCGGTKILWSFCYFWLSYISSASVTKKRWLEWVIGLWYNLFKASQACLP